MNSDGKKEKTYQILVGFARFLEVERQVQNFWVVSSGRKLAVF